MTRQNFVIVDDIDGYRVVYDPTSLFRYAVFAPGEPVQSWDERFPLSRTDPRLASINALEHCDTRLGARWFIRRYQRRLRRAERFRQAGQ